MMTALALLTSSYCGLALSREALSKLERFEAPFGVEDGVILTVRDVVQLAPLSSLAERG